METLIIQFPILMWGITNACFFVNVKIWLFLHLCVYQCVFIERLHYYLDMNYHHWSFSYEIILELFQGPNESYEEFNLTEYDFFHMFAISPDITTLNYYLK